MFEKIKDILCRLPNLNNFNFTECFEIQTDASERAIGYYIFQNNKPIYYASRCFSDSEVNFAQVGKEMPAIYFACKNFIIYYTVKTLLNYSQTTRH